MNEKTARLLLGIAIPGLLALVFVAPFLLFGSELADRVATHFTASGVPDGSMSPTLLGVTAGVMFLVGLVMCSGVALYARPVVGSTGFGVVSLGAFLMALAAGIVAQTVIAQRGLDDWTEARLAWLWMLAVGAFGLAAAALAARLATHLPHLVTSSGDAAMPVMDLPAGEHAVWSATMRSQMMYVLSAAGVLVGFFLWIASSSLFSLGVCAVVSLAVGALASVQVRADRTGLHITYASLPWPRTEIGVADIESASVIDVRPMQWGGWGYRGSLKIMKQAAVVLRAGPGIRLDLRNGKIFVVTVDHPENAVALLNAEIARR